MSFSLKLTNWYRGNLRDLPWRNTRDPYQIWISEVILQQTRVNQGLHYFHRFIERFPDVAALAGAPEQEVLRMWQGLGYYSRARNLHSSARMIMEKYEGKFPESFTELMKLKGVGEYTAAAIASIAYGLPCPAVDGNVLRFIARVFGIETPIELDSTRIMIRGLLREHMPADAPGDFNQALMEFGALVCKPGMPDCGSCIFSEDCLARRKNIVNQLPVRIPKKPVKERYFHYFLVSWKPEPHERIILFEKRTGADIWKGLYQLPLIETPENTPLGIPAIPASSPLKKIISNSNCTHISPEIRHLLTHRSLVVRFYHFDPSEAYLAGVSCREDLPGGFIPVSSVALKDLPVPRLIERYLQKQDYM